jgi:cytochrome b6
MKNVHEESGLVRWLDERTKILTPVNFLRTKEVPRHKHAFWYIFGGLALFFLTIQIVTGVLLLLYYSPTPGTAYESVSMIVTSVPFGWFIRSIHSWSSNLLIAVVLIHLFSVFFLKAYRKPREAMWLTGVALLFLILGFAFTGYLLPWDTTAYFATQIGTEIPRTIPVLGEFMVKILRGGEYIAEESLKRLFALHVVILPLLAIGLASLHVVLNQVQGSSVPIGVQRRDPPIPFFPNYLFRDLLTWTVGLFVLLCCALIFPVQLGTKADPFASAPVGIKPEWYFLPLFQTLRFMPAEIMGVSSEAVVNVLVMVFTGGLFLVPFLDRNAAEGRRSPLFTVLGLAGIAYFILTISLAYLT